MLLYLASKSGILLLGADAVDAGLLTVRLGVDAGLLCGCGVSSSFKYHDRSALCAIFSS